MTRKWGSCTMSVLVLLLALWLHREVEKQSTVANLQVAMAGLTWWAQMEVEAGQKFPSHGSKFDQSADVETQLRSWWFALNVLLGRFYVNPMLRTTTALDIYGRFLGPQDAEGTFCRRVLDYTWLHPTQGGYEWPQVRATHWDVQDFIGACRKEYQLLGPEEREILAPWHASGLIPDDVVVRPRYNLEQIGAKARESMPRQKPYPNEKLSREQLIALLNQSISGSTWSGHILEPPEPMVNLGGCREVVTGKRSH
eukprot:gnl/TRDRNA2_/TRDRNA2_159235_c1_seq2.p1 gnl/TRDRNA2_/TRDRNA2_159235_c1~~gnl/TRDRNA2_/TRDRNA2_159235_c1_seq2.p1  ORF type:complete len:254 (+),score=33.92 gnl/TRDRNA2_/TRDRNA2_159235_c1_seq2:52-813(+)